MTIPTKPLTLEEYLNYDDGTDTRYELIDGRLLEIAPVSDLADRIASFLYAYFLNLGIPHYRLSMKTQIAVGGKLANVRQPDLMVLSRSEEHTSELQSRPHISYAVFCLKKKKNPSLKHFQKHPLLEKRCHQGYNLSWVLLRL